MDKILIIDDEKPTLSMFRLFLNAYGYDVFTAENGQAGMEIYEKESPLIVFTDVKMPQMDGIEVLSAIKKTGKPSEVIVITGHGDIDLAIQSLDSGATDYINKPISRKALDSALKRAEARISQKKNDSFKVSVTKDGNRVLICFTGFIDGSPWVGYEETFTKLEGDNITLKISEDFSINSYGIRGLIDIINRLKEKNNNIEIEDVPENFVPIFEMTGVYKAIDSKTK